MRLALLDIMSLVAIIITHRNSIAASNGPIPRPLYRSFIFCSPRYSVKALSGISRSVLQFSEAQVFRPPFIRG